MAQKHRGRQCLTVARINLIAGQLLAHKTVVWLVGVEGLDDVIAIAPGFRSEVVSPVSIRIGVSDEVQPERRLPLAVAWAGQQAVNQFLVSIR